MRLGQVLGCGQPQPQVAAREELRARREPAGDQQPRHKWPSFAHPLELDIETDPIPSAGSVETSPKRAGRAEGGAPRGEPDPLE